MIHEIGIELGAALALKGFPLKGFPVVDGPEPTKTTTGARERIVIEHDDGGDSFRAVRGEHKNPNLRTIRNIGVKITIYAQATNAGATHWEHRRRAEHVLDLVLVALDKVIYARKNGYTLTKGRFVQPDDLAASEVIAGAVYELTFTVERGVAEQTWKGEKRPEGSPTGFKNTTNVSLYNGPGDPPEVGCGG